LKHKILKAEAEKKKKLENRQRIENAKKEKEE